MIPEELAAIERLARCHAHPVLIGREADRAVAACVAWQLANLDADRPTVERVWSRIVQLAA